MSKVLIGEQPWADLTEGRAACDPAIWSDSALADKAHIADSADSDCEPLSSPELRRGAAAQISYPNASLLDLRILLLKKRTRAAVSVCRRALQRVPAVTAGACFLRTTSIACPMGLSLFRSLLPELSVLAITNTPC